MHKVSESDRASIEREAALLIGLDSILKVEERTDSDASHTTFATESGVPT